VAENLILARTDSAVIKKGVNFYGKETSKKESKEINKK